MFVEQIISYEAEINNLKACVNQTNLLLEDHRARVGRKNKNKKQI